jgi:hypothetical protein
LIIKSITVNDEVNPERDYEKLRAELASKYTAPCGRKYVVLFFQFTKTGLFVTDFFRCVLVDPDYYVKQQRANGFYAIAIDEFTLLEKWISSARKTTEYGVYFRAVQFLTVIWRRIYGDDNFINQMTHHYYDTIIK